jgi:glutamate-1-semialdehyde 2,1-aminomutase
LRITQKLTWAPSLKRSPRCSSLPLRGCGIDICGPQWCTLATRISSASIYTSNDGNPRRVNTMPTHIAINRSRLDTVRERETRAFADRTRASETLRARASRHLPNGVPMTWMSGLYRFPPIYITHGEGASFFDVDGNSYLDFNVCDLSMTMGFGPVPIVEAVSGAVRRGAHFLLPTEDSILVAEELAARVGLPYWQFTLSASGANAEVIRIARVITGRHKILIFEGHYHGHLDETLVARTTSGEIVPELLGIGASASKDTVVLPFNDLEALEARLSRGDIALVLTEPALTNCTLVKPAEGFLPGLRALTQRNGTLLCYDEAHTFQFAYGGLVGERRLECDFVVLGKGLGTGISFGLYGFGESIADSFTRHSDVDIGPRGIATGGTTYATTVAVAAARAALFEVLSREAYQRLHALGERLAAGLDRVFARNGLCWSAQQLGPRVSYCLTPQMPRTGAEAMLSIDADFIDTRRLFLANRGIWDAVASAGPQVSLAHAQDDIDCYITAVSLYLEQIIE